MKGKKLLFQLGNGSKKRIKWDYELLDKLSEASNKSKESLKKSIKELARELNITMC